MLSVGLVGLPNAGKSTLFNLLTKRSVPAENFPFCTIEPNSGIVEVPDKRVSELAKILKSEKEIYSPIEFKDIAGLVKNASQGAGLGNQFLSHIKETNMILLVVRCFQNENVIHVENRVNPQEDEEILLLELMLADQQVLEKTIPRLEKDLKSNKDRLLPDKIMIIEKILEKITKLELASTFQLPAGSDKDLLKWRSGLNLLTDKPILRLANISSDTENLEYQSDFDLDIFLESTVADMTESEREELGLETQTGLDKLIRACYYKLNLGSFLTVGPKESRSWTFKKGMTAPECAGVIHTDFEKNFVKAEVVSFQDFIETDGYKGALEKGKLRIEGKEYIMQDGDVVEFKIGV